MNENDKTSAPKQSFPINGPAQTWTWPAVQWWPASPYSPCPLCAPRCPCCGKPYGQGFYPWGQWGYPYIGWSTQGAYCNTQAGAAR